MSDKILDAQFVEQAEPMTPDELIAHLVQDVVADSELDELAEEFISEFILTDRPESGQILSLLDTPSESLVELVKGFVGQSYQATIDALDSRGVRFLDELRMKVKERMTQLASDTI